MVAFSGGEINMRRLKTLRELDFERQSFFANALGISIIIIAFLLAMGVVGLVMWSMN